MRIPTKEEACILTDHRLFDRLTRRQQVVLVGLAQGLTLGEIIERLRSNGVQVEEGAISEYVAAAMEWLKDYEDSDARSKG